MTGASTRGEAPASSAAGSRRQLVQIGPDPSASQGGMATVIGNLLSSAALNGAYDQVLYPSFRGGAVPVRLAYAKKQLLAFRPSRCPGAIFHIHLGPGRSAWRKIDYIKKLGERSRCVVLHVHASVFDTFFDGCSDVQKDEVRRCFNSVGRVIVLSEEWRDYFLRNEVCAPELLQVVHNAVRIPAIGDKDYGPEKVLFLGRLCDRKSPETLIRAAAQVAADHPRATYTFAGDGDATPYAKLARELGIEQQCSFPGWKTGAAYDALVREHTVFCLPSKGEGMPMAMLEAMSYGLPAIVTPVGGVPQVIADGGNGALFPVGDVDVLASRLGDLLSSEALRREMGLTGRQSVVDGYGMDAWESTMLDIYKGIDV